PPPHPPRRGPPQALEVPPHAVQGLPARIPRRSPRPPAATVSQLATPSPAEQPQVDERLGPSLPPIPTPRAPTSPGCTTAAPPASRRPPPPPSGPPSRGPPQALKVPPHAVQGLPAL